MTELKFSGTEQFDWMFQLLYLSTSAASPCSNDMMMVQIRRCTSHCERMLFKSIQKTGAL